MGKSQSGMISMNDDSTDDGLAHTVQIKCVQPSYFKGLGFKTGGLVQNTLLFIDHKWWKVNIFAQWVDQIWDSKFLSCKIHKAKTQTPKDWADKFGIHSLVKLVWQASRGASRPPFHSKVPSPESLLHRRPCYILQRQRHLLWFVMYLFIFTYNVCAIFFLPVPSLFLGAPLQFVSNLKNTHVKRKGKACLECALTPEGVTLKWLKNGWVIERSPEYTKR